MLLSGWQQALTVLLAVVPGFVYQGARAHFRGPTPDERDIGVRILRALALSGIFALLYVGVLGERLTAKISDPVKYLDNPHLSALWAFLMVFAIPFGTAAVVHVWNARKQNPEHRWRDLFRIYNPTPTAWDFASQKLDWGFVRVLTKDGAWVGGFAGDQSFFTGYPEEREIFLEVPWTLDSDGVFGAPVPAAVGMWIRCDDAQLVQFIGYEPQPPDPS
ncbi:DUF6338 family protein [Rhodococcus sp. BH5]|uniref:DUF6338 family protein n=1 Tax=Rhodococcus sp. BH5 TaxID=2871702 RepID=UPI0022CD2493|nr:DUF6338 family protein [Rhodococcus sp. BH5]MCZ9634954.1 DUF6338 family protein [Rhodococcus sp. BH5]